MELKNKKVLVVGLGRSGAASAIFLQEHGARVIVSDSKSEAQLQGDVPALLDRGISIETGQHGERTFRDQDLIVVSPGVPSDQPQLQHARSLGIPAVTIGGGGEGGNWHSRNEWYKPVDAYYGPQNALLTILMLTGLDGVTKPALAVRQGK